MCQCCAENSPDEKGRLMKDVMIGVDLAKTVFQIHAASMTSELLFRKKIRRPQFLQFMASQPPTLVVMEACGSAPLLGA
jgi:transposase